MVDRWILQLCHGYSGPFLDVARQYAALFKESPFKVLTVYLTGEPTEKARVESASDEVIFLDYSSRDIRGLKIGAIRALRRIAVSRNFALVIAHRFKPIYVACLATRLPVIGVHHAFGDYDRPQRRGFARLFRERLSLLAVSNAVRDDIRKRLSGWAPERIETLYNRLDVAVARARLIPRVEARSALGLPQDAPIIANVGRLHPDKDQLTLLRGFAQALPRLPEKTLLIIAGEGPLKDKLKACAQQLNVTERVRFLGQVPDIRRFFRAFDLFVLSSDHEPFGMVLLEAMVADVPILATNCGGAPEVVESDEQLFPLQVPEQLAIKLESFFSRSKHAFGVEARCDNASRLEDLFSDDAARRSFFKLDMVQKILK